MFPQKKFGFGAFHKPTQPSLPVATPTSNLPTSHRRRAVADVFAEDDSDGENIEVLNPTASSLATTTSTSMVTTPTSQISQPSDSNTSVIATPHSDIDNEQSDSTQKNLSSSSIPLQYPVFNKTIPINIKINQPKPIININANSTRTLPVTLHDNSLVTLASAGQQENGQYDNESCGNIGDFDEVIEDTRARQIQQAKKQKREMYRQVAKEQLQPLQNSTNGPASIVLSSEPDDWPRGDNVFCFYVGNLSKDVNNHLLEKTFKEKHSTSFLKARVVYEHDGKTSRGFGFVAFSNPLEMAKAFSAMDGQFCGERRMFIKKADAQDFRTNHDNKHVQYSSQNFKKGAKRR